MLNKIEQTLLFLVILFLPTQLGRHFWPDFSYLYSLPVDYLSPTVYFWSLLTAALLVVWLLSRPIVNSAVLNLLFIFLFFQASSVVFAGNIGAGLVRLEQYLLSGLFGVYLASKGIQVSRSIMLPLSLAVGLESLLAMIQFINKGSIGLWVLGERSFTISTPAIAKFDFYGQDFLRPYATFSHPNVLAAFLLISLLILSLNNNKLSMMFNLAIGVLGSITLLLTTSRTVILLAIVSAVFLLKGRFRMVVLLIVLLISPILVTRYLSLIDFDNLALQRREELLETSVGMFVRSPILGIGLNNFIPYSSTQLISGQGRFLQPVHNIFLLELSETGILGFLGFLWFLGYPIYMLFKLRWKNQSIYPVFLLCWAVIIFLGMFDHYFLTLPQGYRLLFMVWGLTLTMAEG